MESDALAPGKSSLSRESGFKEKDRTDEIAAAEALFRHFGGSVTLLAEKSFNDGNPDYLWNGRLWDLKKPSRIKNPGKLVQKGLSQIFGNPGGSVIDISNMKDPPEKAEKAIEERLQISDQMYVFVDTADVCPRITAISFTGVPISRRLVARLCLSECKP